MIEIKDTGSFFEIDTDGYLINPTSWEKIQQEWRPVIESVVQEYKKNLSDSLHSIYIRGSVAKGEALQNLSDLDSFAYVAPGVNKINNDWIKESETRLLKDFPFVAGFEFCVDPISRSEDDLVLLNQSLCVFGTQIPVAKIKPGRESMIHAPNFRKRLDWFSEFLKKDEPEKELKNGCVWLMKGILRVGSELTMERSKKYTRDLYKCYEVFSEYYPTKETEMREVLHHALNPTPHKLEMKRIIDSLSPFLLREIEKAVRRPETWA